MEKVNKIEEARKVMRSAFKKDPDFKRAYRDNVAMLLYDNRERILGSFIHKNNRDFVAEKILNLIFN